MLILRGHSSAPKSEKVGFVYQANQKANFHWTSQLLKSCVCQTGAWWRVERGEAEGWNPAQPASPSVFQSVCPMGRVGLGGCLVTMVTSL